MCWLALCGPCQRRIGAMRVGVSLVKCRSAKPVCVLQDGRRWQRRARVRRLAQRPAHGAFRGRRRKRQAQGGRRPCRQPSRQGGAAPAPAPRRPRRCALQRQRECRRRGRSRWPCGHGRRWCGRRAGRGARARRGRGSAHAVSEQGAALPAGQHLALAAWHMQGAARL